MSPKNTCTGKAGQATSIKRADVRLSDQFSVDFTFAAGTLLIEWSPDVPTADRWRKACKAARDKSEVEPERPAEANAPNAPALVQIIANDATREALALVLQAVVHEADRK